jgi:hypothetical protein
LRSDSITESLHSVPKKEQPKKIVRKCPVVVDTIIVLLQLGLTVTFGFFAYYYQAINRKCVAATGSEYPLD